MYPSFKSIRTKNFGSDFIELKNITIKFDKKTGTF